MAIEILEYEILLIFLAIFFEIKIVMKKEIIPAIIIVAIM